MSAPEAAPAVTLRPAEAGDEAFLFALYRSTREQELAGWGWSAGQQDAFLKMQFAAQRRHYEASYPDATHRIIVLGERPIGRMLVAREPDAIHLVDIALLPGLRGGGIGTALIRGLLAEGRERGVPVRLSVLKANPALRLYERLGFSLTAESGMHLHLERPPGA